MPPDVGTYTICDSLDGHRPNIFIVFFSEGMVITCHKRQSFGLAKKACKAWFSTMQAKLGSAQSSPSSPQSSFT